MARRLRLTVRVATFGVLLVVTVYPYIAQSVDHAGGSVANRWPERYQELLQDPRALRQILQNREMRGELLHNEQMMREILRNREINHYINLDSEMIGEIEKNETYRQINMEMQAELLRELLLDTPAGSDKGE